MNNLMISTSHIKPYIMPKKLCMNQIIKEALIEAVDDRVVGMFRQLGRSETYLANMLIELTKEQLNESDRKRRNG